MTASDIRFHILDSNITSQMVPTHSSKAIKGNWKFENFFSTSCKKKHMVNSQLFSFHGYTGKLSVFPKGTITSQGNLIVVLYLNTGKSEIEIIPEICKIGIESNNVKIVMSAVSINTNCIYCNFGNLEDVIKELSGTEDYLMVFFKLTIKNSSATEGIFQTEGDASAETNRNIHNSASCICPIDFCIFTEEQCANRAHAWGEASKSGLQVKIASVQTDQDSGKSCHREKCLLTKKQCSVDKMLIDIQKMLYDEDSTDVTIKVKEQEFKAHRCILSARVPAFLAMHIQNMPEGNTVTVALQEYERNIFEEFLHYVYTGSVKSFCPENVFDLYKLSEKYKVDQLKEECLKHLKEVLTVDTFCDVITLALKYDEPELLRVATEFFCKQLKDIITTIKWKNFICENPAYVNELLIKRVQYEANQNILFE